MLSLDVRVQSGNLQFCSTQGVIKATRVDKPTRNNVASKEEWKGVSKARQVYEEWLEIEKTEKG